MIVFWVISISLLIIASILHGLGEARDAQKDIFEVIWGKLPLSFWGGRSSDRKYLNNDPSTGKYKSWLWKRFPFDFEHVSAWISRPGLYFSGIFTGLIIACKFPLFIGLGGGFVVYLLSRQITHLVYQRLKTRYEEKR